MPIYVYQCLACGEKFELLLSMSKSTEPQICPKCKSKKTAKEFTPFGLSGGSCSTGTSSGFG